MKHPVYLDYNATTPVDPEVVKEMIPYIESYYGNPSSSYSIGRNNKEAIKKARGQVAKLISCKPEEIYFTSCATESNNLSIKGIALANSEKGRHIITSAIEHPAVTEVCKYLGSQGFEITYLPVDQYGRVDPGQVKDAIRQDTILLGKACEIAMRDFKQNQQNMIVSRDRLIDGLVSGLGDKVHLNSNLNNCLPNTLSVAFENVSAHELASIISSDVLISTGSACHSGETTISSVLQAMNLNFRTATATVRISTGKNSTEEEIDFAIEVLINAINKLSL